MTIAEAVAPAAAPELVQLVVPVRDLDEAHAFYAGLLKLPELFRAPNVVALAAGRARILLTLNAGQAGRDGALPYFSTSDIDSAYQHLVAAGSEDAGRPHRIATLGSLEVWIAQTRDPSGNMVGLIEERPG